MDNVRLTPKEAKDLIKFFVKRNQQLEKEGQLKNSLNLVSEAGIGKTSIVEQVADDMGMVYEKLMLSTSDELGDLVGFPYKQYEVQKEGRKAWIAEKEYNIRARAGWSPTGHVRTAYAPPSWVQAFVGHEEKGGILNIDDAFRCLPHFNQAIMSLIDRGEYYDWKLPPNVHIVLTNNPDDGEYFVQAQDQAQATRYFTYELEFDINSWAEYAENEGIDGRCINFMLSYHDQVLPAHEDTKGGKEGKLKTNPRQWTKFFNAIGGISNFNTPSSLGLIKKIGQGIVGEHVNSFVVFINNKFDQLIEPDKMLHHPNFDEVVREIKSSAGDIMKNDNSFNDAIASILMTRFTNYTVKYVRDKPLTDKLCDRIEDIAKAKVFGEDHNFKMFRDACHANSTKFAKLITRPYFMETMV